MSLTALITGAEGALGKALLALLGHRSEYRIVATSRRPHDPQWLALDVSDRAQVLRVIAEVRPDLILHLAATLNDNVDAATAINVEGARNLCEAVLAARHPTRVLLTGSAAEYGVVEATANPVSTHHPLKPVSVYGSTKAAQTTLGQDYARKGVDVVIARIFNLDGPGISDKLFVGRVQKQIAAIKAGEQTRLRVGPLNAIRDYVPLATAAEQILMIAERGVRGTVYHVGSGKGISMRDLLQQYLDRNGLDFSLVDEDSGHSNRKGYDVPAVVADMSGTSALQSGISGKTDIMLKLTVVTPAYNEEQVIESFYRRTRQVLDALPDTQADIVFVVDKGRDRTVEILRGLAAQDSAITVLALSSRFGHQMSLLAGIEKAQDADAVVMMDCDLQHPPELIPQLLANFGFGYDVVYTLRKDTEDASWLRKRIGNLFYRLLSLISDVPINANAADFRLISGRVTKLLVNQFPERNMFLRGLFSSIGFKQTGIEYVAEKRHAGESKYSFSRMLKLAAAGILSSSTKPLQLGIVLGLGFSILTFLFMLYAVAKFFVVQSLPDGFTTIVVLVVMLSGIQLIMMGIMGAYIGAIFTEVKGRPRYIVEEEISTKKPGASQR